MKKLIMAIVCLMTMIVSVNAQRWETKKIQGDELMGTKSYQSISYSDASNGGGLILSNLKDRVCLYTIRGIFDYDVNDRVGIIIGFYNSNKALVKSRKNITMLKLDYQAGFIYSDEIIKEIYQYLSSNNGYVRIVIPRYEKVDLDLKIPCNKIVPKC